MLKKSKYGGMIKNFNSVENCATLMMVTNFVGLDAFVFAEELAKLTIDDCMNAIDILLDTNNVSISIIDNNI